MVKIKIQSGSLKCEFKIIKRFFSDHLKSTWGTLKSQSQMKIQILLKELQTNNNPSKSRLRIRIGDNIELESAEQMPANGVYPWLQRNILDTCDQELQYMSIELLADNRILANKTLFVSEALNMKEIELNSSHKKYFYKLSYQLTIFYTQAPNSKEIPGKTSSIFDQPASLSNEEGKLKILKLGILVFNFAQRLDPVIRLYKKVSSLMKWEKPEINFTLGFVLTFLILFPKTTISILCIGLILAKQRIYKEIQIFQQQKDLSKRLLLPEQNLIFLQTAMQNYCDGFEKVNGFLRDDDRSHIIAMVEVGCKMGALLLILQLFIQAEHLFILGTWFCLFATSPSCTRVFNSIKPYILSINSLIDQMTKKIGRSRLGWLFRVTECRNQFIVKEFYIYEYQRWWLGKKWVTSHWSNEDRDLILLARSKPPQKWSWMNDWEIQYSQNTDQDGFEYTNEIKKNYSSSKSLKTLRRRRWTRKCMQLLGSPNQLLHEKQSITDLDKVSGQITSMKADHQKTE